ncbi:MAG: hypothetical protein QOG43_779, partial [Actinomycetota bacterium]|nr:hypothetical protein [Actinomycetota bacterium]
GATVVVGATAAGATVVVGSWTASTSGDGAAVVVV